ncbi:MAG TPA: WecB/TagA/CpsF family glycosyltransferase [Xanthomonadales bacterium]|nr:WecB/TagA/CpsF family glycosyltransferase [Xanthomonadales bacterium]
MLNKTTILGTEITNETTEIILEYLLQGLKSNKKFYITTPNPEILVYARSHKNYKNILNSAEISLPDGSGLFLASILLGKPFKQRIPGVDFLEFICKNTVRNPISMGFLGGRGGVAEKTAKCLMKKYPHLKIVYVGEEWGGEGFLYTEVKSKIIHSASSAHENQKSKLQLKSPNGQGQKTKAQGPIIDLLFVAYGAPMQEEWIYKNLDKIPVKAAMGVGGAFDYISGGVKRAPFMIRAIGFEWLYRLFKEPWRWKRQLALIEFVRLVFKERFAKR